MMDPSPHPSRRRRVRWWHVALACFLLLLAAWGGWRVNLRRQINAELARIRAEGYPVTPAELDAWYPYPEGENAAGVYRKAFAAMVEPTGYPPQPTLGGAPVPEEMLAAMEAYLDKNAMALRLLHEAGKVEGCRWPETFSVGFGMKLAHHDFVRRCARLLEVRATVAALRDDSEATVQALSDIRQLARSLNSEPIIISTVLSSNIEMLATSAICKLLPRTEFSNDDLKRLARPLSRVRQGSDLTRPFATDRCMGIAVFDDPRAYGMELFDIYSLNAADSRTASVLGGAYTLARWVGIWDLDLRAYLRITRHTIDVARKPSPSTARLLNESSSELPAHHLMTKLLLPANDVVILNHIRRQIGLDLTLTALAAERYRLAHGDWPAALDDLVPDYLDEVPADPYNHGKPLSVKRHDDRLVIYSFGQDQDDDGGTLGGDEGFGFPVGDGDVIFTLYRR